MVLPLLWKSVSSLPRSRLTRRSCIGAWPHIRRRMVVTDLFDAGETYDWRSAVGGQFKLVEHGDAFLHRGLVAADIIIVHGRLSSVGALPVGFEKVMSWPATIKAATGCINSLR